MSRNNQILAAIAVFLSLLLLVPHQDAPLEHDARLSPLSASEIEHIQLQLGGRSSAPLLLSRRQGGWQLDSPVSLPADEAAVGEILRLLSSTSQRALAADSLQLDKLMLAPPLWRVTLNQQQFEIGGTDAINGLRYVRVADTVHLVADLNPARFDNNYADLVVRDLLPDKAEISQIQLPDAQQGQRSIQLADDGAAALFERWRHARAQWLLRPNALDYQDVHSRVTLQLADGRSIDFLIRSLSPQVELIQPQLQLMYILPGSAREELLPGA